MTAGVVRFIGAGPGDPELLTLKAQRLIAGADVVLHAGSLVNPAVLANARADAVVRDTARMPLGDQVALMVEASRSGRSVARLHTGDPSVYGAIGEQIAALREAGVPIEVVPGVSSVFAAAAALALEFTAPGLTQTLILTRLAGRTAVPEREALRSLAAHGASMAIFLSTGMIRDIADELRAAGYPEDAPVAVVYRASWPDQRVVEGTVATIAGLVEAAELTHQGLVIVSPVLGAGAPAASHLYGEYQATAPQRPGTSVLAITAPAARLARRIAGGLPDATLHLPTHLADPGDEDRAGVRLFRSSVRDELRAEFAAGRGLVCVMASGIVVRELGPVATSKHSDPPVVVVDALGEHVVSLLGGHEAGANALARQVARITGGRAVITTASDVAGIAALDQVAAAEGYAVDPRSRLAPVMAAAVDGFPVAVVADEPVRPPESLAGDPWVRCPTWQEAAAAGSRHLAWITVSEPGEAFWASFDAAVVLHPPRLFVGVGCNRGTPADEIAGAIRAALAGAGLAPAAVAGLASIDAKRDEAGLLDAARELGLPLTFLDAERIGAVRGPSEPSAPAMRALGVAGVAEPAALLAAGATRLLVPKRVSGNVTVAIAAAGEGRA